MAPGCVSYSDCFFRASLWGPSYFAVFCSWTSSELAVDLCAGGEVELLPLPPPPLNPKSKPIPHPSATGVAATYATSARQRRQRCQRRCQSRNQGSPQLKKKYKTVATCLSFLALKNQGPFQPSTFLRFNIIELNSW